MAQSFSLARAPHADGEDPAWRAIIRSQTGSDAETDSILRSIARFGNGAGIQRYEITPVERRGHAARPGSEFLDIDRRHAQHAADHV